MSGLVLFCFKKKQKDFSDAGEKGVIKSNIQEESKPNAHTIQMLATKFVGGETDTMMGTTQGTLVTRKATNYRKYSYYKKTHSF